MLLRVGLAGLRGDISRYARHFDLLELRAEPGTLPRPGRLRDLRTRVPAHFVFSVALPSAFASLERGAAADRAGAYALRVAEAVGATWLVLQTPASVTPSERTRRRIAEILAALPRERWRIAWEPRGVWEAAQAEALATLHRLHLVRDLTRDPPPPGAVLYSRLRGLGRTARFGEGVAQVVASRVRDHSEACVVFGGAHAVAGARRLRSAMVDAESDAGSA